MKASQAKRLKKTEAENARLERLAANQALDIDMLKELLNLSGGDQVVVHCTQLAARRRRVL
jgi:hypothetical protein